MSDKADLLSSTDTVNNTVYMMYTVYNMVYMREVPLQGDHEGLGELEEISPQQSSLDLNRPLQLQALKEIFVLGKVSNLTTRQGSPVGSSTSQMELNH